MTSLLQIDDVHVAYGKVEAIHGVTLAAERKQITTIIGSNGAGKTTLLSAMAGLQQLRSGRILFDGVDITRLSTEERVDLGLVLVHEKRELFADMAVEDNLLLGGYCRRRLGRRALQSDMDRVYDLFPRLLDRRKQHAGTLSGGERQMLALGRALMAKPRLLLLDEPSLGLAPVVVSHVLHIVGRLRDDGIGIVLVEQNARAALAIAETAFVIETGRITLQGPAAELAQDPRVAGTYLGVGSSAASDASVARKAACA